MRLGIYMLIGPAHTYVISLDEKSAKGLDTCAQRIATYIHTYQRRHSAQEIPVRSW